MNTVNRLKGGDIITACFMILIVSFVCKTFIPSFATGVLELLLLILIFIIIFKSVYPAIKSIIYIYFSFLSILVIPDVLGFSNTYGNSIESILKQLLVYGKIVLIIFPVIYLAKYKTRSMGLCFYKCAIVLTITNLVFCLIALIDMPIIESVFEGAQLNTYIEGTDFRRSTGLLWHPTALGFVSSILAIYFFSLKNIVVRISYSFSLINIFLLFLSGQRGEFVFLVIALVLSRLFLYFSKRDAGKTTIVWMVCFYFSINILASNLDVTLLDVITNVRGVLFLGAFHLADLHFPLGSGIATYGSFNSLNSISYYEIGIADLWWFSLGSAFITDTLWAMVIAESGYIGATIFFGFICLFLLKVIKYNPNTYSSVIIIFIILETSSNPIFSGSLFLTLFGFIAIIYCENNCEDT